MNPASNKGGFTYPVMGMDFVLLIVGDNTAPCDYMLWEISIYFVHLVLPLTPTHGSIGNTMFLLEIVVLIEITNS